MVHTSGASPVCLVYLVDLVCFVYLVDLVHLVSFVQLKNQIDQTNQINQMPCQKDPVESILLSSKDLWHCPELIGLSGMVHPFGVLW